MDIRGIEITNQLRSAIRAKLLELGVRYDEELPDYILVMVVNKKTRQQMHDDLFLFLEDSTTPFVEWLHDQVLKKLQKVTVAKRKSSRDLVPSVVVKQEEDKKKRKTATTFLEDNPAPSDDKEEKQNVRMLVSSTTMQEVDKEQTSTESSPNVPETRLQPAQESTEVEVSSSKEKPVQEQNLLENVIATKEQPDTECDSRKDMKRVEKKRHLNNDEEDHQAEDSASDNEAKKLKSSVIKPRITSVVSVKSRLGIDSLKKNRERDDFKTGKYRGENRRSAREDRTNFSKSCNFRSSEAISSKKTDLRNRLGSLKQQETQKYSPVKSKLDLRDRLGQGVKVKEQEKSNKGRSVRNRLGPIRSHIGGYNEDVVKRKALEEVDDNDDDDDEEEEEIKGPVRSRIIAVNKPAMIKESKKDEEEDEEKVECKVPSKVIVTPRPLKPLQPAQKRATQSLLLRAVAEANQSVVMQKNPEPSMKGKRPVAASLRTSGVRNTGNNLSVCLNKKNRFVMENIQVELSTDENTDDKNLVSPHVSDEHLGVVKSLFQRSDDNHTFLVTLNGYNNDNTEYTEGGEDGEDEEGGLEMEVNENDELTLSNSQPECVEEEDGEDDFCSYDELVDSKKITSFREEKRKIEDDGENQNNENAISVKLKKRKLSPIIYVRSPSPKCAPIKLGPALPPKIKTPKVDSNVVVITDKSKEKCRYWPSCTLGNKCAYYHPPVMCSAFPACKFGEKCAYQHPKCKFGISCTKLGCIFSHQLQQCKYHPFCTKPGCTFSHPAVSSPIPNPIQQRAKFTWKRQD